MDTEKYIKKCLIERDTTVTAIAEKMGMSRQALHSKINRKIFKQNDLEEIAAALDCHLEIRFIDNKTNEPLI